MAKTIFLFSSLYNRKHSVNCRYDLRQQLNKIIICRPHQLLINPAHLLYHRRERFPTNGWSHVSQKIYLGHKHEVFTIRYTINLFSHFYGKCNRLLRPLAASVCSTRCPESTGTIEAQKSSGFLHCSPSSPS